MIFNRCVVYLVGLTPFFGDQGYGGPCVYHGVSRGNLGHILIAISSISPSWSRLIREDRDPNMRADLLWGLDMIKDGGLEETGGAPRRLDDGAIG